MGKGGRWGMGIKMGRWGDGDEDGCGGRNRDKDGEVGEKGIKMGRGGWG